jgi:hypothetical protein
MGKGGGMTGDLRDVISLLRSPDGIGWCGMIRKTHARRDVFSVAG